MYESLIMIDKRSSISFDTLVNQIKEKYSSIDNTSIVVENEKLDITIRGWRLSVDYSEDSHVVEESKGLADQLVGELKTKVGTCTSRFEVSSDEDENMDFFNEYCILQQEIEELGTVYIFDCVSGEFSNLRNHDDSKPWWKFW